MKDMARQGRTRSETGIYHVLLRGVDMLFGNNADYDQMYNILKKYVYEEQFKLIGYAFLKNRVHLIVNTMGTDIGKTLKPVCTSYARYFNRVHNIEGKLFYDRFKSEPIDMPGMLPKAIAFINAAALRENAVRASIIEDGEQICDYASGDLTEAEFKEHNISEVFLEDYECLSREDINDIIYSLSGVMPEDFQDLSKQKQAEMMLRLTQKRWLAKTRLYKILGADKT